MKHLIRDFELELIDEPMQEHVVAWERAARALRNEDAKPYLSEISQALEGIKVTSQLPALMGALQVVSAGLQKAMKIIDDNETLTLSSNRGMMVKAAIVAGWVIAPELTAEAVDKMPAWKVSWIAEKVAALYHEATEIPKN